MQCKEHVHLSKCISEILELGFPVNPPAHYKSPIELRKNFPFLSLNQGCIFFQTF